MRASLWKSVLLSPDLMGLFSAIQGGVDSDMAPFVHLHQASLRHSTDGCGKRYEDDELDADFRHVHASVIAPWLAQHGLGRLGALFARLPYTRVLVVTDAVYFGHLSLLQHVHNARLFNFEVSGDLSFFDLAALGNRLDVMEFLHAIGDTSCTYNMGVRCKACESCHDQPVLQICVGEVIGLDHLAWQSYLDGPKVVPILENSTCDLAAGDGLMGVIDQVYGLDECTPTGFIEAAINGHVDVLKWFTAHIDWALKYLSDGIEYAAGSGQLATVQYLYDLYKSQTNGVTTLRRFRRNWMDDAAENGHLHVVHYLHQNCHFDVCTQYAIDGAATNGHLEVVQWLNTHRREGCTKYAIDGAATNGHLEVVQWLNTHRRDGCRAMAAHPPTRWLYDPCNGRRGDERPLGHAEVATQQSKRGLDVGAVDLAAEHNHLEVVQWLQENQETAVRPTRWTVLPRMGISPCLRGFMRITLVLDAHHKHSSTRATGGHLHVVQWLIANVPQSRPHDFLRHVVECAAPMIKLVLSTQRPLDVHEIRLMHPWLLLHYVTAESPRVCSVSPTTAVHLESVLERSSHCTN
ncbi:Aste57867_13823 [Aphanomyces stellatus]|uniref:Aste57867_13823 protein n=1 Tax=Aphanomyces stellatus TaxID=120398 RepID=A0A485KZ51_9STRA|nr:hypothetical protein As57867_013773 [Aphanomyces stellatus]VFT90655.1 Aste57867_13823 [Aphanomyces stellatus]